jgi:hypothetical protein
VQLQQKQCHDHNHSTDLHSCFLQSCYVPACTTHAYGERRDVMGTLLVFLFSTRPSVITALVWRLSPLLHTCHSCRVDEKYICLNEVCAASFERGSSERALKNVWSYDHILLPTFLHTTCHLETHTCLMSYVT